MNKTLALVFSLALSIISAAKADTIYDAAADFSATSNPTSTGWSYGYYTSATSTPDPTTFVAYPTEAPGSNYGAIYTGLDVWYDQHVSLDNVDPNVIFNPTNSTIFDSQTTWTPGELTLGPYYGPSVVRFTVPTTGLYEIAANFYPSQTGLNTPPAAYLFDNSSVLGSGVTTPYAYNSLLPILLTAGTTIDFVAYSGPGNSNNQTTGLDATLTMVPEPETLTLFVLGGVGLLWAMRRRRQHSALSC